MGFASLFLLLNLWLCFAVSIPIVLLYLIPDMAFVFRIRDDTSFRNTFLEISLTQRQTNAAIDLERNILVASFLRNTASVKVMMYSDIWYKDFIVTSGIASPLAIWCGFACALYIWTTPHYHVGQELYGFAAVILVWLLAKIIVFLFPLFALLLAILNLLLCCIPSFLFKRLCKSWVEAVQGRSNFLEERAVQLEYSGAE